MASPPLIASTKSVRSQLDMLGAFRLRRHWREGDAVAPRTAHALTRGGSGGLNSTWPHGEKGEQKGRQTRLILQMATRGSMKARGYSVCGALWEEDFCPDYGPLRAQAPKLFRCSSLSHSVSR